MGRQIKGILLHLGVTITLSMHIASGWCTVLCTVGLQFGIHIHSESQFKISQFKISPHFRFFFVVPTNSPYKICTIFHDLRFLCVSFVS